MTGGALLTIVVGLNLSDLLLQSCSVLVLVCKRDLEALLLKTRAVAVLRPRPINRVHLIQRVLNLLVLLAADVGATFTGLASRQFEVEVDT